MLGLTTSAYAPHVTSCAARNAERCCENSELHGAREELATPDCAYIYLSTTAAISEKWECAHNLPMSNARDSAGKILPGLVSYML